MRRRSDTMRENRRRRRQNWRQAKPVFDEKGESGALPTKRALWAMKRGGNGAAVNFARASPRAKAKLGTARGQTQS